MDVIKFTFHNLIGTLLKSQNENRSWLLLLLLGLDGLLKHFLLLAILSFIITVVICSVQSHTMFKIVDKVVNCGQGCPHIDGVDKVVHN